MDECGVEGCIDAFYRLGAGKLGGCISERVGKSRRCILPDGGAHVGGPFERFEKLATEFK